MSVHVLTKVEEQTCVYRLALMSWGSVTGSMIDGSDRPQRSEPELLHHCQFPPLYVCVFVCVCWFRPPAATG